MKPICQVVFISMQSNAKEFQSYA